LLRGGRASLEEGFWHFGIWFLAIFEKD
jgi:hypothetical protein